jgi:hypothetical protein
MYETLPVEHGCSTVGDAPQTLSLCFYSYINNCHSLYFAPYKQTSHYNAKSQVFRKIG